MSSWSYPADSVLPWNTGVVEDVRFRRWLLHGLGIFLMMAIILPFMPAPEVTKVPLKKERSHYTRLIIEEKPLPPPPVIKKEQPRKKLVQEKKVVEKKKPKPVVKEKPKPVKKSKPVDLTKQARDKAAKSGVLAFADDLAAMRQKVDVSKLKTSDLKRGAAQAAKARRNLLTSKAAASVGGISVASLSSDTGGVALSARETTKIDAPVGESGEWADEAVADASDYSGRTSESVRRIMDANKGAIFAIYNRALRKDPALAGKVLFNMVIEPSGVVSGVELVSSELTDSALVRKILARIKLINFGDEPVAQTNVNYSFDFLPY